MVASFPESDCDAARFFAPLSSSIIQHAFASDTSSNLSCSSSSTDTSGTSTRRSSWEKSASIRSGSSNGNKPHQAQDTAWKAIRSLRLRDGSMALAHFKPLRKVGRGDIGSVYLAQLRGTACLFALKIMDKQALTQRNKVQRMHIEKEILELVDHPFLPTLYGHFETEQYSCLVTEFCSGGDLHARRQRQSGGGKRFGLKAARFYAAEVLVALEYLHMLGVVYRDLKPENVLVRDDGHIMLTDFDLCLKGDVNPKLLRYPISSSSSLSSSSSTSGRRCLLRLCSQSSSISGRKSCLLRQSSLQSSSSSSSPAIISCLPFIPRKKSSHHSQNQPHIHHDRDQFTPPQLVAEPTQARSMSFVGTHEYLAPEIIAGFGHGNAVDWWTFGIFLFELLFGRTPFKGSSNDQTLMNIMRQHLRFPEEADIEAGEDGKNLIQGLLMKDPRKRLGSSRGAMEIKQHEFFRGINWALIRCAKPPEIPTRMSSVDWQQTSAPCTMKPGNHTNSHMKPKIRWSMNKMISDLIPQFEYF